VVARSKGENTQTAERSGAARSGQQLAIQFVETKRSVCFHELNHKLLAAPRHPAPPRSAPLYVCFYPKAWVCGSLLAGLAGSNPSGRAV
jgi:hypothetical protein